MIMAVNINRASGSGARFGLAGKAAGTPAPVAKPKELASPPWPSKRCRGRRILEDLDPSSPRRHAHHQPRTQVRRGTSGGSCLGEQYPVTSLGRVSGSGRSGAGCPRPAGLRRPGPPSLLGFDLSTAVLKESFDDPGSADPCPHPVQGRAGRGRDELAVLQGDREHVPLPQAQFFPECRGQHHPAPVSHAKLERGTHDSRVPPALEGGRLGDSDPRVIPTPGSARVRGDRMSVHPQPHP